MSHASQQARAVDENHASPRAASTPQPAASGFLRSWGGLAALGLSALVGRIGSAWAGKLWRGGVALADLVLNHASLSAYAAYARKVDPTAAYRVAPYLGWLTFAGALNGSIVARNSSGFTGLVARLAG